MNKVELDSILSLNLINVKLVSYQPPGAKNLDVAPTLLEYLLKNNKRVGRQYSLITQSFPALRLLSRARNNEVFSRLQTKIE